MRPDPARCSSIRWAGHCRRPRFPERTGGAAGSGPRDQREENLVTGQHNGHREEPWPRGEHERGQYRDDDSGDPQRVEVLANPLWTVRDDHPARVERPATEPPDGPPDPP